MLMWPYVWMQNVKAVFDAAIRVVLQPPKQKKKKSKAQKACSILWWWLENLCFYLFVVLVTLHQWVNGQTPSLVLVFCFVLNIKSSLFESVSFASATQSMLWTSFNPNMKKLNVYPSPVIQRKFQTQQTCLQISSVSWESKSDDDTSFVTLFIILQQDWHAMTIDDESKIMQKKNELSFKPFHFDFQVFLTHATILLLSLKLHVTQSAGYVCPCARLSFLRLTSD